MAQFLLKNPPPSNYGSAELVLYLGKDIFKAIDSYRTEWVHGGVSKRDSETSGASDWYIAETKSRLANYFERYRRSTNVAERNAAQAIVESERQALEEASQSTRIEKNNRTIFNSYITTRENAHFERKRFKVMLPLLRDLDVKLKSILKQTPEDALEPRAMIQMEIDACERQINAATSLLDGYAKDQARAEGYLKVGEVLEKYDLSWYLKQDHEYTTKLVDFLLKLIQNLHKGERVARMEGAEIYERLNEGVKAVTAYSEAYDRHYGRPIVEQTDSNTEPGKSAAFIENGGKPSANTPDDLKKWDLVRKGIEKARKYDAAHPTTS